MALYYKNKSGVLFQGDCLDVMKIIPDKSIDMILCDLPYGNVGSSWDIVIPFEPLWKQYERIIKDNTPIVLFGSQPFTTDVINSNRKMFKYEWIWHKNYSGSFVHAKKMPMKYHENILVFYKQQPIYNPIFEEYSDSTKSRFKNNGKVNVEKALKENYISELQQAKKIDNEIHLERGAYPKSIQFFKGEPTCNGLRKHPTQKPVLLFEYLIKTYTDEGMVVLDNTCGSGTTGVACMNLNRKFIMIEKEEKYCEISKQRLIEKETKNTNA